MGQSTCERAELRLPQRVVRPRQHPAAARDETDIIVSSPYQRLHQANIDFPYSARVIVENKDALGGLTPLTVAHLVGGVVVDDHALDASPTIGIVNRIYDCMWNLDAVRDESTAWVTLPKVMGADNRDGSALRLSQLPSSDISRSTLM